METERTPIPAALRMMILARDNFTCRYCGRRAPFVELHIDHTKPFSRGGNELPSNLVTACVDCNLGKSNTYYVPPRVRILDVICRFLNKRIVLIDGVDYRMFRAYQAGQIQEPERPGLVTDMYAEIDIEENETEQPDSAIDEKKLEKVSAAIARQRRSIFIIKVLGMIAGGSLTLGFYLVIKNYFL